MVRFLISRPSPRSPHLPAAISPAGLFLVLAFCLSSCRLPAPAPVPQQPTAMRTQTAPALPTRTLISLPATHASPSPTPLASPTLQPSSTPIPLSCWSSPGHFESGSLDTDLLRNPLEFRIFLPPCYAELPHQAYPVLYLIHGQSYNDDQWERLGAGDLIAQLSSSGELPPFIIVMPRDRLWSEPTEDKFGQAVAELLLPWIDARYRTLPERQYRAVGGLSRGGAWALHLGITYPELFSAVGMHSGFAFHTDAPYLRSRLESIPTDLIPRFYLDVADNDRPDIYDSAVWFEAMLTEYNITHEWHIFQGYHEESYWQSHVEQYLRWYAQEW